MSNKSNSDIKVDFTDFDKSLERLVLSIAEWHKKNNIKIVAKKSKKRVIKKLNVELIKKVLKETQEMQKNQT